ncbi:MAG: hypothetical protein ACW98F_16935, partial [Candidatus Hodarchaeales archaeon]
PYDTTKTVPIDIGIERKSLYETTSESFLVTNVTGTTSFEIPADTAFVVVITPADGILSYNGTRTLINNVTVDYEPVEPVTTTTTDDSSIETTTTTRVSPYSSVFLVTLALSSVIFFLRKKRIK